MLLLHSEKFRVLLSSFPSRNSTLENKNEKLESEPTADSINLHSISNEMQILVLTNKSF